MVGQHGGPGEAGLRAEEEVWARRDCARRHAAVYLGRQQRQKAVAFGAAAGTRRSRSRTQAGEERGALAGSEPVRSSPQQQQQIELRRQRQRCQGRKRGLPADGGRRRDSPQQVLHRCIQLGGLRSAGQREARGRWGGGGSCCCGATAARPGGFLRPCYAACRNYLQLIERVQAAGERGGTKRGVHCAQSWRSGMRYCPEPVGIKRRKGATRHSPSRRKAAGASCSRGLSRRLIYSPGNPP